MSPRLISSILTALLRLKIATKWIILTTWHQSLLSSYKRSDKSFNLNIQIPMNTFWTKKCQKDYTVMLR